MTYADVLRAVQARSLDIFGAFHPGPGDGVPPDTKTLVLLGPREPGFWDALTASPEWDGNADPVDRWSVRVIGGLANKLDGTALFPFGGPPYQPFISWALKSGRAWQSPVTILVHDTAGLMVSYRGAIALTEHLTLPPLPSRPCDTCDAPCLTACPADALTAQGYDVPKCHGFLDTSDGADCMNGGCLVRRACPVSQSYGRVKAQSAYHMSIFHKGASA